MDNRSNIESFLEYLGEAIILVNADAKIEFANQSCTELFGYRNDELLNQSIDILVESEHRSSHAERVKQYIEARSAPKRMTSRPTMYCLKKCGHLFTARISLSTMVIGGALCGIAIIQDYTTLQKWVENIEHKANTDSLTLLYNRHYLDTVTLPDNRWFRSHHSIAVLYLDLNGFKPLNDQYGHAFGDFVLKTIAQRMKENLRLDDLIFRVGGDEFVIMLPLDESDASLLTEKLNMESGSCSQTAKSIAEKLHKEITLPINFEGKTVNVGVSIGVGLYPHDIDDIEITIKLADKAMYYAKQQHQPIAYVSDLPKIFKQ